MATKNFNFTASEATREKILLRAGFCGPTGSGKSLTALKLATRMEERMRLGRVFVIDSEHASAKRYAFSPRTGAGYRFKHVPMPEDDFSPAAYTAAIDYCESQGAGVIVIDSLSHAWVGINGVLELVDETTSRSRSKNAFSEGWKAMTPVHNRFVERIMQSSAHVLFTLRAKVDWVVGENERGKVEPKKVGLAPVQREGLDYEPDLFFDLSAPDNDLFVTKSRAIDRPGLEPGARHKKPDHDFCDLVIGWLEDGDAVAPRPPQPAQDSILCILAASDRAARWKTAIREATTPEALDALTARSSAEPHPKLKADVETWIVKRRQELDANRVATLPPEPTPPVQEGAFLMSDAERLRAIDQGQA